MCAVGYMLISARDGDPVCQDQDYCRQRLLMLRLARRLGARLGRIPCDRAELATQGLAKRICLAEVLALVRFDWEKKVIISSLERLELSEIEAALLIKRLQKFSAEIWEATTGVNLSADLSRWQKIISSSNHKERKDAAAAIMQLTKIATRLRNKSRLGRKPFGSTAAEQEILQKIWALRRKSRGRRERISYHRIADILNEDGIKPRQGKKWYPKTIQDIVKRTKPHLDRP